MKLKRIDAIDINYVDSAADPTLKVGNTSGAGEARLYAGHDEKLMDDFFELDKVDCFFMLKTDLLNYMDDSKDEYFNPSRDYREQISKYYQNNLENTQNIADDRIKLFFRKKYDTQNRYYLVLENISGNRKNYAYLRNICLPRMTVITFVKFIDEETSKKYIYLKPIFYIDPTKREVLEEQKEIAASQPKNEAEEQVIKEKYRKKQTKYRLELLDKMPSCLITKVSDDRLLVACHVKPYADCETDEEKYDVKNGIVLTPTYHTLFDLGFISFSPEGKLLVSPFLSNLNKQRLNLHEQTVYRLQSGTEKYMKYHREKIFNTIKFDELDLID